MLRTNRLTRVTAILLVTVILISGCSREKEIVAPKKANDDLGNFEAKAHLYVDWIERMEPYVTESKNGTFSIDWSKFLDSIQGSYPEVARYFQGNGQPSELTRIIEELRDGIPTANDSLSKGMTLGKVCETQGSACWWYWWGKRCCYWSAEGWRIVTILAVAGSAGSYFIPPFGWVAGAISAYLCYYMSVYGGFCLNQSWVGGLWVTRP
ncbi:MAG: hypothetical protein WCE90_03460 [Candidatus Zixiibacteriota bacterium]